MIDLYPFRIRFIADAWRVVNVATGALSPLKHATYSLAESEAKHRKENQ